MRWGSKGQGKSCSSCGAVESWGGAARSKAFCRLPKYFVEFESTRWEFPETSQQVRFRQNCTSFISLLKISRSVQGKGYFCHCSLGSIAPPPGSVPNVWTQYANWPIEGWIWIVVSHIVCFAVVSHATVVWSKHAVFCVVLTQLVLRSTCRAVARFNVAKKSLLFRRLIIWHGSRWSSSLHLLSSLLLLCSDLKMLLKRTAWVRLYSQ